MSKNKLYPTVKLATAALAMGITSQASAVSFTAGDAKVDLYGFARVNAVYDIDEKISGGNGGQAGNFGAVNTGIEEENEISGHFDADAAQSRIGIRANLPTGVKVNVEGDFRTSTSTLRLRHAYGQYKNWTIGQTWSNFNSFVGNTPTIDMDGAAGNAGLQSRRPQIRYSSGPLSFSVEDAVTRIDGAAPHNRLPTLTARYETKTGKFTYSAAALAQEVGYDDGVDDDSAIGYAVFGSGKFEVTDSFTLRANVSYTDGGNGYLYRSGDNYYGDDAYVFNGHLQTISGIGGNIGASLNAAGGTFNFVLGMTDMDWDDAQQDGLSVGDKHERNTNAFINYQWSPAKNVTMGLQYGHFKVKEVDGDDGDASRVAFAAIYNF